MAYQEDSDYYRNRAAEEHQLAQQAADATVSAVHNDLARRYGARFVQLVTRETNSLPKS